MQIDLIIALSTFIFTIGLFLNKQSTFIQNGQMAALQLWSLQSYNNNHFTPKVSDEISVSILIFASAFCF